MTVETLPQELRRSPLVDRAADLGAPASAPAALAERPFLRMVDVRADPGGSGAAGIARFLGTPLPTTPNTVVDAPADAARPALSVLWLGPDEWLVVAPAAGQGAPGEDGRDALTGALRDALGDAPGSVVGVSAQRTTVTLSGPRARDVLAKGCSLDLHPRVFSPGRCVQTLLARAQVVLWRTGGQGDTEPSFRILVRSSFADYLADWLLDAAAEFRGGTGSP